MGQVKMSIQKLLYVDFDGRSVTDPDEVIAAAVDDQRYLKRVGPLTAVLQAVETSPWDRFMACYALTAWAEPAGYAATIAAARDPERVPWLGVSIDRRSSADDTFAHLAGAVATSSDLSQEKGTEEQRVEAVRALLGLAADHFFDWQLAFALDETTLPQVRDDLRHVIDKGVTVLAGGRTHPFDLATQLADLAAALTVVDEPLAVDLGHKVAEVAADSYRTLNHLTAIVSRGHGEESLAFGEYLELIGNEELRRSVAEARTNRT
jgi:hypothetical protein